MQHPVDDSTFDTLVERYRGELRVHCYRMLGSFEDAEDLVQETLFRAWRSRSSFAGRSTVRTWLYRIATNVCLDALDRRPRRVLPADVTPAWDPTVPPRPPVTDLPFLQPYPDLLLDAIPSMDAGPDAVVVTKESIELAFIAAIQYLPPRQRAILILREVLDWSANETAALLDVTVPAVKSALQRARASLKQHLPARQTDWSPATAPSEEQRSVLLRYMLALEHLDVAGLAALLSAEARMSMPPLAWWYDGREAILTFVREAWRELSPPDIRLVASAANRQPAVVWYVRAPGQTEFRALALIVLRVEAGAILEITTFLPTELPWLTQAFGLAQVTPS